MSPSISFCFATLAAVVFGHGESRFRTAPLRHAHTTPRHQPHDPPRPQLPVFCFGCVEKLCIQARQTLTTENFSHMRVILTPQKPASEAHSPQVGRPFGFRLARPVCPAWRSRLDLAGVVAGTQRNDDFTHTGVQKHRQKMLLKPTARRLIAP